MLTGVCLEEFEKWLKINLYPKMSISNVVNTKNYLPIFYNYPFPMQWGAYQDFFDSVGVFIGCDGYKENWFEWSIYDSEGICLAECNQSSFNRQEAREAAIKKAVEIYSNRTNE